MQNVYTVKQVNQYIKNMFNQDFMMNRIHVKGEVSNCKYHTTGHIYFSLKDESGSIGCIMFASARTGLDFRLRDGQQVVVFGMITTYERDGKYQLYAKEILLDGAGLLAQRFQELKEQLEEMGMFASEYKQPIPKFARKIGIVTAPTGAAIRDVIHISRRRNPYVQLILSPALVQGEGAADSIVNAIRRIREKEIDVLIVGRGGGSMEDLWAFNEEKVARAIFECPIPVISAVGHETDTTIADYVADMRAPTPSAAAELAVYEYKEVKNRMEDTEEILLRIMENRIRMSRMGVESYRIAFKNLHPRTTIVQKRQRLMETEDRIRSLMEQNIQKARQALAVRIERFKGLSPVEKLNSGYCYVSDEKEKGIRSVSRIKPGDRFIVHMADGTVQAKAERIKKNDGIK